jgi:hypothetical protein
LSTALETRITAARRCRSLALACMLTAPVLVTSSLIANARVRTCAIAAIHAKECRSPANIYSAARLLARHGRQFSSLQLQPEQHKHVLFLAVCSSTPARSQPRERREQIAEPAQIAELQAEDFRAAQAKRLSVKRGVGRSEKQGFVASALCISASFAPCAPRAPFS